MSRRPIFELALATAATLLLFGVLPQSTTHALRAMVALLPLVGALFAIAQRSVRAPPAPVELALWLAWVVLAFTHHRLGLAGSPTIVALAGFLLAAARAQFVARGLARAERGALLAAFAAALAFLLFLWPWSTSGRAPDGDEPYFLLLTHSLAEEFDVDLADEYRDRAWTEWSRSEIVPQPGDPLGENGEVWSRHGALLPLLLSPFYAAGGFRGAELAMIALAAALAAATFAAIRRRLPEAPEAATAVWALLLLAPPLFIYSGRFWSEVPAALSVAVALWAMPGPHGASRSRRDYLWLLAALAALPLLKLRFLALALPLAALAWRRIGGGDREGAREERPRRNRLALLVTILVAAAAVLTWNQLRFGNPLRIYDAGALDLTAVPPARFALGLVGLFFDIAFGLFATAPLWLLLVPACAEGVGRRRLPAGELLAIAPYLLFVASRREWYGGWSPPFRYGLVLLPALALLLAPLFERRPRSPAFRAAVATLCAATALSALVAFARPAWTFSLADGGSRALEELATVLEGDLGRFTPSAIRPRAATWLWLVAAPAALLFLWSRRGDRRRPAAATAIGVALVLAGGAAWLILANRLPTRQVEVEDAWVQKRGGALHPKRWTLDRTRETGGWTLIAGAGLTFTPASGGEQCRIGVRGYYRGAMPAPLRLEIVAGGTTLARLEPAEADAWTILSTPPLSLPPDVALEIRAIQWNEREDAESVAGQQSGDGAVPLWIVDRVELDWS